MLISSFDSLLNLCISSEIKKKINMFPGFYLYERIFFIVEILIAAVSTVNRFRLGNNSGVDDQFDVVTSMSGVRFEPLLKMYWKRR
ncbi:hypothetical protein BpHYR1_007384 [Brachionus plicatilis]|uniref:Uncharacterized protein n=1 Tax=Brachionus plicatilis TaxID=10195 RepID=A0A3M7PXC4_BRAPC|nr:hypothetical protein BpHYR1_007384 [Brachionus plicatilis]